MEIVELAKEALDAETGKKQSINLDREQNQIGFEARRAKRLNDALSRFTAQQELRPPKIMVFDERAFRMDLTYWGFRHWPFERTLAADRFFGSPQHEEAMARMLFLIEERRRLGIVTGPSGSGKTYLLRLLQQQAERLGRTTVDCQAAGKEGKELLSEIANGCQFDCDADASSMRLWSGLQSRLSALAVIEQPLVVLIDHFDQVEPSGHQMVRRLSQLADAEGVQLTLLLASRDRQISDSLQEIVDLRVETYPWTSAETMQFVGDAIRRTGVTRGLFTDEALLALHSRGDGIPSAIVALANLSLLVAMGRNETLVTCEFIEAAASELLPDRRFNPASQCPPELDTTNVANRVLNPSLLEPAI